MPEDPVSLGVGGDPGGLALGPGPGLLDCLRTHWDDLEHPQPRKFHNDTQGIPTKLSQIYNVILTGGECQA